MRLIIIYDLSTQDELIDLYVEFRRNLLKMGFIMIQYSIYSKVFPDHLSLKSGMMKVKSFAPTFGNIRMFYLTEKQYSEIEVITGNKRSGELYSGGERYIEI